MTIPAIGMELRDIPIAAICGIKPVIVGMNAILVLNIQLFYALAAKRIIFRLFPRRPFFSFPYDVARRPLGWDRQRQWLLHRRR